MGLTFDTGVLIAIERRQQRALAIFDAATVRRQRITVSTAVVAEWWRGRWDLSEDLLAAIEVEPLTEALARVAGEAQSRVRGATVVDAVVMASAAARGDVVYTADFEDLMRLRAQFPAVRVLRV